MAEIMSSQQEKTDNKAEEIVINNKQTCDCTSTFNTFDIFCVLFSLGTFVADLSTDIILVVEYSRCGHIGWAVSTLLLMLLPASVIQLFSLRWHKLDEKISVSHYIFHACLLGIAQRYYLVLRAGLEARASGDSADFQKLYQQQSDLCMLHLFDSFMESAPQLVLQLYVMANVGDWHSWTGISASASLCSLAWAIAAYTRAMRRVRPDKNRVRWPGLVLQATWRGGMLAARICAMVLFTLAFHYWILLAIGLHWLVMTIWIIFQNTDFCPTVWEERIYNGIVGVIYCFSFFNICEGRSRKRVFTFYLIVVTQNFVCFILIVSLNLVSFQIVIISAVLILGGTLIGLSSMALYYIKFHPAGPIQCCPLFGDIESVPSTPKDSASKIGTLRSLKYTWSLDRGCALGQTEGVSIKSSPHPDDSCTDKKLLLENWIARSGSPMFASAPISQQLDTSLDDIEFHTVANSADSSYSKGVVNEGFKTTEQMQPELEKLSNEKEKRRGICSAKELELKLEQLNENVSQKRRGICSSDQLVLDLKDFTTNDDVKLKRKPIYSVGSTLNNFSVKLLKISDDKSVCSSGTLKPEEYMEMSSEVLSAHDYENICAVNIARERWGLRSWEGYSDIETFLHDDSTVRDRRRDTLTSTVTGTSSEISSSDVTNSPPLLPKRTRPLRSRQDDYLDTLIYDLVDCDKRCVQILDCVDDYEIDSNVFIAKPYVVDQYGMFFPLGSTLEPIEELEEPANTSEKEDNSSRKPRSALVATIDEIRRETDTDSPRNVYHRSEHIWDDDDDQEIKIKVCSTSKNVVKALWSDCVNENCVGSPKRTKAESPTKKSPRFPDENVERIQSDVSRTKSGNKPRRKFSLLREKFEPKLKESDESLANSAEMGSTVNLIDDLKSAKYTSPVISKVMQWNNVIRNNSQDKSNTFCEGQRQIHEQDVGLSLRDKRNVFLKQVLSPPKFNRTKRQSISLKEISNKCDKQNEQRY